MLNLKGIKIGDSLKIWQYRNNVTPTVTTGRVENVCDTERIPVSETQKRKRKIQRSRYLLTVSQGDTYRSYYTEFLFGRKLRWYEKLMRWFRSIW